jgi:DNA-directed RNA polymerase subunit RPC12/RpoP
MYIEIKQIIECSKCGSRNHENFYDSRYQGTRCLDCGHERKDLHPHFKETTSSGSYSLGMNDVIKF